MKHLFPFIALLLLGHTLFGQSKAIGKKDDEVLQEGLRLYRSELTSWYGTDLFMERLQDKAPLLGGYLSYQEGNQMKCVFFTKDQKPSALVVITFDSTFNLQKVQIEDQQRPLTSLEEDLITIRQTALARINADTLFRNYNNASLNLVPLIDKSSKKVYVLTGPKIHGVVLFGNDYLLTFDKDNKIRSVKKLHQNLIPVQSAADSKELGKQIVTTMHSHLPESGDHITATDICTLLLYQKFTTWKQHLVLTPNNVSIWDCSASKLVTMSKEAWEKMSNQEKLLSPPETN
ncbi:hypothetical protein [Sabulibacter ruber]|uniref:hypothetical protein n=1 Tax=Sabulibacter ruber TaxID=2811901 RepID=UPI001A97B325|nr:hypothetical protein [Sabulibacter ruber]